VRGAARFLCDSGAVNPDRQVIRRRRARWLGGAAAFVVAIAVATAVWKPGFAIPPPVPTPLVVAVPTPEPTATIPPAPRAGEHTALLDALPDVVRQFAQAGIANLPDWQDANDATESWTVTYTDRAGADAATMTLSIGQWATTSAATSFATAQMRAAGAATRRGDVSVGGQVAGTYALVPGADGATGAIWWRNGTVVAVARGPLDELAHFYSAYPL
jgi:hypothetical protein